MSIFHLIPNWDELSLESIRIWVMHTNSYAFSVILKLTYKKIFRIQRMKCRVWRAKLQRPKIPVNMRIVAKYLGFGVFRLVQSVQKVTEILSFIVRVLSKLLSFFLVQNRHHWRNTDPPFASTCLSVTPNGLLCFYRCWSIYLKATFLPSSKPSVEKLTKPYVSFDTASRNGSPLRLVSARALPLLLLHRAPALVFILSAEHARRRTCPLSCFIWISCPILRTQKAVSYHRKVIVRIGLALKHYIKFVIMTKRNGGSYG